MPEPGLALTIQSHVAWGHVGNSAAVLPLQLLGVEAVAVHTVQFSNHTGYGEFKGQVFPASHIRDVLDGLHARGVLARCDAVLSGYLGDAGTGEVILEAVSAIRQANPGLRYICDPVMGDVGRGMFVRPGIPEFLRHRALPACDVLTPNQFEFEFLAGQPVSGSVSQAVAIARELLRPRDGAPGPATIVITSLRTDDMPADRIGTLAVSRDEAWCVQTPLVTCDPPPSGMGDVFAATLTGRLLNGESLAQALSHTVSCLYGLVSHLTPGARDLPLVAARSQITHPDANFDAVAV